MWQQMQKEEEKIWREQVQGRTVLRAVTKTTTEEKKGRDKHKDFEVWYSEKSERTKEVKKRVREVDLGKFTTGEWGKKSTLRKKKVHYKEKRSNNRLNSNISKILTPMYYYVSKLST